MKTQRYITLTKEKTFEYLTELKETITQAKTPDDLPEKTHRQLYDIINAEEKFLKKYHPEPMIAIAPNGLPTTETLKADLETMSKLEEFKELTEKYLPNKENNKEEPAYNTITEKEWNNQKNSHKKLTSKTRFNIGEQEGRLELTLTEEHYTRGYDEYSQRYPLLTRECTTKYRTEFGILIPESEEQYKVANVALTAKNKELEQTKKYSISKSYIKKAGKIAFPAIWGICTLGMISLVPLAFSIEENKSKKIEEQAIKQLEERAIKQREKLNQIKEAYPELNIQVGDIYGAGDTPEYYYATDKNELVYLNKNSNLTETYYALEARMKTK